MNTIFEPEPTEQITPETVVAECIESGSDRVLLDRDSLVPEFSDLSSGFAGELLHRLSVYRLRMAAVVSDGAPHGERFEEFVREANRGQLCRFFPSREEALAWLES